jgi:PAS domain S-box-containing protein
MQWLFPSVVATLSATLIFASVYVYLFYSENEKCFGIWAISWLVYSARYIFLLIMLQFGPHIILQIAIQIFPLIGAILLMYGTGIWLEKKFSIFWVLVSFGMSIWIIVSIYFQFSFIVSTIPPFFFMGLIYIKTGIEFINKHKHKSAGKYITGIAFILWGIHKMDFPILRPVTWFAPWGYLLASLFTVIAAIGLILVYFEKNKHELILSERNFRAMIQKSPLPMVVTKENQDIEFYNDKFIELFGYTLKDISTSEKWWQACYPDEEYRNRVQQSWMDAIEKAQATNTDIERQEWEWTIKDSSKRLCEYFMVPLSSSSLIIMNDITDRRQAEKQIKDSLREKETLIHEIHHRVKNNMNVVSSLLKLQENSIEDDQTKDILRDSRNRIFALSAVHETLHGSDNLSEIDLKKYLFKISTSVFQSSSIDPKKIKLKTDIEEISISVDQASPLGLIINELISNSVKYAFPDGREGEISVSIKKLGNKLELAIKDDGVGMPNKLNLKNANTLGLKLVRVWKIITWLFLSTWTQCIVP